MEFEVHWWEGERGWEMGERRKIGMAGKKSHNNLKMQMFITHWRPVILLMQKLMSRFVFPLNYQKTESQSSSQNAKVPITKSLEDFMIDRLPNQSPVHDLQVHVLYFLLIKIVCTHWFFMVDENDISPSCCRLFTCTNYRPDRWVY